MRQILLLLYLMPGVSVLVDPVKESLEKAVKQLKVEKQYTDYRVMLDDDCCDAVVIATPTKFHKEMVIAAANAGKHILCEKPMAVNTDECEEMLEAIKKNNVKLQIGFYEAI